MEQPSTGILGAPIGNALSCRQVGLIEVGLTEERFDANLAA